MMAVSAVAPMMASDVPTAWCWVQAKTAESAGTRTSPPPTPNRPLAAPAPSPARRPRRRSRVVIPALWMVRLETAGRDGLGRGVLHQPHDVGEARGVRGRAHDHRDHVALIGADPGREAVPGLRDEAGLAAADLVAPVQQPVGVRDVVRARAL